MAEQVGGAGTGRPGKLPPEVQERNREIIAERLGWPAGAVSNCRQVEAGRPRWYCWWTPDLQPGPGFSPTYGPAPANAPAAQHVILYARSPGELAGLIRSKDAEGSR